MDSETILNLVEREIKGFYYQSNLRHVDDEELSGLISNYGVRTQYGNLVFSSFLKDNLLSYTVGIDSEKVPRKKFNSHQKEILTQLPHTLDKVHHYMKRVSFICMEKTLGYNEEYNPRCILFTSTCKKENIKLPFLWNHLLFSGSRRKGPKLHLLCIPEWPQEQRQVLVFPEIGVTYVLGSDYLGEIRDGFLRMARWAAKQSDMLGIPAGVKLVQAKDESEGELKKYGVLFFGLPNAEKTLHFLSDHGLRDRKEKVEILQKGLAFWKKGGGVLGAERGVFLKAGEIKPEYQRTTYRAALSRNTLFQNVLVDHQGRIDFQDHTITSNGRAIIQLKDLGRGVEQVVDLPPIEELDGLKIFFFSKESGVVPPVSRLTTAQAAAIFMNESPVGIMPDDEDIDLVKPALTRGINSLLIGAVEEEGKRLLDFLQSQGDKVEIFLLNTGEIGGKEGAKKGKEEGKRKARKIDFLDTLSIMKSIFKGNITWQKDSYWKSETPLKVEGLNLEKYNPNNFYSAPEIQKLVSGIRREQQKYLRSLSNLPPTIKDKGCL